MTRKYQEGTQFIIKSLGFCAREFMGLYPEEILYNQDMDFIEENVKRHLQLGEKVTLLYSDSDDYRVQTKEGYVSLFMEEKEIAQMMGDQRPILPTKEISTIEVLQQLNDWTSDKKPKTFKRITTGVIYEFGVNTKGTKGLKYYAQGLPQYTLSIPLEEKFIEIDTIRTQELEEKMKDLRQEQHELRTKLGQIAIRKDEIRKELKELKNI